MQLTLLVICRNLFTRKGEWLSEWKKLFECLEINHLRSTVLAHPDPFDIHSLLAFANRHNRTKELFPIDPLFQESSKISKLTPK